MSKRRRRSDSRTVSRSPISSRRENRSRSRSRSKSRHRSWSSVSSRSGEIECRSLGGRPRRPTGIGWDTDDDVSLRDYVAGGGRNRERFRSSGGLFRGLELTSDATEERMKLRKRALVLGNFRFVSRQDGMELESAPEFLKAVEANAVRPVPYASKPLGYTTIPRSKSTTRYSIVAAEFPGGGDRYHVAWSSPTGRVHVDGMVKLYDLRSVQAHYIECDSRGPKSQWFGLVDPRLTDTPEGRIQFDANMFWTVGLFLKHFGTCGVEDWDEELAGMARTHIWDEAAGHRVNHSPERVHSQAQFIRSYQPIATPGPISHNPSSMVTSTPKKGYSCRYTGCVVEWRISYGFVSCFHIPGKVFLHSKDIEGWSGKELPIGCSVNFQLQSNSPRGNKAVDARLYI